MQNINDSFSKMFKSSFPLSVMAFSCFADGFFSCPIHLKIIESETTFLEKPFLSNFFSDKFFFKRNFFFSKHAFTIYKQAIQSPAA